MRARPHAMRLFALVLLGLLGACQVVPPSERASGPAGTVRAASRERADEVLALLGRLEPRVRALLPDSRPIDFEVWVQAEPRLYAFTTQSYDDADGFWASAHGRIHLRDSAESLERTLAHELTHALLGPSWSRLPGTLEEGLCDWVSAELCPDRALSMRAGRLSAASLGTGGMELEIALLLAGGSPGTELEVGSTTRVLLHAGDLEPIDPMQVFVVRAGLSTSRVEPAHKKAFYGLSYLLVSRIVDRVGLSGLHALCLEARRRGLPEVPSGWLLDAAGIDGADPGAWRRALGEAFGASELRELVSTYPELVAETLRLCFGASLLERSCPEEGQARARIGLCGSSASVELSLPTPWPQPGPSSPR